MSSWIIRSLGLTDEETSSLLHLIGVAFGIGMAVVALGTAVWAFVHNLHLPAGTIAAQGWSPAAGLVALDAGFIAGGIFNNYFNTATPQK